MVGLTSCSTTSNMSSIQIEVMKPGRISMSEDIDTITVSNRYLFKSDTTTFRYFDNVDTNSILDSAIQFRNLSNQCVDALASYLENEGYFLKVINYKDSMNDLFTQGDVYYPELYKKWKVDACIFLDYFQLTDNMKDHEPNVDVYNFEGSFPEFKKSTKLEQVTANLYWTVSIRGDTVNYVCKQPDNLYYGNSVYPEFFGSDLNHKLLLENSSIYLGQSFGKKLLPSWQKVERNYYQSRNVHMLKAEKFFLNGDYLKAAEIYNRATSNKNRNIAAKAKYNMALICEMEGNLAIALDWLLLSYSTYKMENPEHEFNCDQYSELLELRKKEIERLDIQVRD